MSRLRRVMWYLRRVTVILVSGAAQIKVLQTVLRISMQRNSGKSSIGLQSGSKGFPPKDIGPGEAGIIRLGFPQSFVMYWLFDAKYQSIFP